MFIDIKKHKSVAMAAACAVASLGSVNSLADNDRVTRTASRPAISATNTIEASGAVVALPTVGGIQTPSLDVNPQSVASNIHGRLAGKSVGYAFVVVEDGQLAQQGQGGFARVPMVDGPGMSFTTQTDVNIMSVSKSITAIALLQLMDKLDLQPNDPIAPWLPPGWSPGLGFGEAGITFFDLLTHRTGIQETITKLNDESNSFAAIEVNRYPWIQAIVEHGIYPEFADLPGLGYSTRTYKNANYKLAAILIWRMALATGDINPAVELNGSAASAAGYQHYVRKNVLQAAGVDGYCFPTKPLAQRALAYDINQHLNPVMFTKGWIMGSFNGLYTCGPTDWWLSAMDLAAIAAHLQHGELLSDARMVQMDALKMGWDESSNSSTRPDLYWHGGLGMWSGNGRTRLLSPQHPNNPSAGWMANSVTTADRMHSCLMKLPEGLEATLLINSGVRNSTQSACQVLRAAYDEAL